MFMDQPKAAPMTAHQEMQQRSLPAARFVAGGFT